MRERVLLGCGAVGPPLFVVVFLVEGPFPAGYSPLRHPVSSLALTEFGWVQDVTFVVTGLLLLGFAAGLRDHGRWLPLLVAVVGIGLIGAGFFPTDPVGGYPVALTERTVQGHLHDAFSGLVFGGLPAACLVSARRSGGPWARYSVVTAVVFLAGFVLAGVGFAQGNALAPVGGLFQRITIIVGFAWLTALAGRLLRREYTPDHARTG